jgi:hypothetical protein
MPPNKRKGGRSGQSCCRFNGLPGGSEPTLPAALATCGVRRFAQWRSASSDILDFRRNSSVIPFHRTSELARIALGKRRFAGSNLLNGSSVATLDGKDEIGGDVPAWPHPRNLKEPEAIAAQHRVVQRCAGRNRRIPDTGDLERRAVLRNARRHPAGAAVPKRSAWQRYFRTRCARCSPSWGLLIGHRR